jgi:hypothetical protein
MTPKTLENPRACGGFHFTATNDLTRNDAQRGIKYLRGTFGE